MEKTSLKIKMLYNEMGKAEKQIADWIMENPGKIISLSIVELAEQCKCGEATIVRFSKITSTFLSIKTLSPIDFNTLL